MECAKVKQLLSGYVDGTLNEQKRVIVEGHLAHCKLCLEEAASLKAYAKLRIKIPLKSAVVAAAVLVIFAFIFVFKVVQPAKKIPYTPSAFEPGIIAKEPKEEPVKIAPKEEIAKTAVILK
ncbi:MAG: zf-HC2 domain-containing protein, partial [Candidatus Omnitrophota bacterium]